MVGNHVRFLEERLGTPLLNRSTRRQSVTEFGRSYYERCRSILMDVQAADASAGFIMAKPRGLLRVTAPLSVGTTVLPSIVASYLAMYPDVHIDLVLDETRRDLLTDKLDVAIRVGALPASGLIVRALPPKRLLLCASPAYLAARGVPRVAAELTAHECLDFFLEGPHLWRFSGPQGDTTVAVKGRLRINNGQALRVAALEGVGIIMPPASVVADDIAAGRLIQLLPDHVAPILPLHALILPDAGTVPKVSAFIDALVTGLNRTAVESHTELWPSGNRSRSADTRGRPR